MEMETIEMLRLKNIQKRNPDAIDNKFCICQKEIDGILMIKCELCKDLFHCKYLINI